MILIVDIGGGMVARGERAGVAGPGIWELGFFFSLRICVGFYFWSWLAFGWLCLGQLSYLGDDFDVLLWNEEDVESLTNYGEYTLPYRQRH